MMNLDVENLDQWWTVIQAADLERKYPGLCWHIGVNA